MISGLRYVYIEGVDIYFKAASSGGGSPQVVGKTTAGYLTSNWIPPPPCPPDPANIVWHNERSGRMVSAGVGMVFLATVESVLLA